VKLTQRQRDLRRQILFAFMVVYAVLLFLIRPDATTAQVVFRVVMMVIGVIGVIYVELRKRARS
jgi:hypothetical protein